MISTENVTKQTMEIVNFKIIKDYILGKSSPQNTSRLLDWLNQSEANGEMLFRAELMYHEGREDYRPSAAEMEQAEADVMNRIMQYEGQRHARIRRMAFLRYAAVGIVIVVAGAMGLWAGLHMGANGMISVTAQNKKELMLPDGSKVWLNKNATISYQKDFEGDTREVKLVGEALFHVVKNPAKPFVVSSGDVSAKVLGTVFDFKTQCRGNTEEVTLLEGRLEVAEKGGESKVTIHPNQKIVIDKNNHTMEVSEVYAPIDAVWHDEMIPFRRMSVDEIADVLEQLYHVDIVVDGSVDRAQTYSGAVPHHGSVGAVLRNLSNSIPITYHQSGNKIVLTSNEKMR